MSSVAVISTTAVPPPASTSLSPSQAHARDGACVASLTTLSLRHWHAGRGSPRDQAPAIVEHVSFAEQQGLLHLDDPTLGAQASIDDRAKKVDFELDGR